MVVAEKPDRVFARTGRGIVGNSYQSSNNFGGDPGGEAGIETEYEGTHPSEAVAGTPEVPSHDIGVSGDRIGNSEVGVVARTVSVDADDTDARAERRPYSFGVAGDAITDCEAVGIGIRSGASGVIATNTVRNAGTAVDVDAAFVEDVRREQNVIRD